MTRTIMLVLSLDEAHALVDVVAVGSGAIVELSGKIPDADRGRRMIKHMDHAMHNADALRSMLGKLQEVNLQLGL